MNFSSKPNSSFFYLKPSTGTFCDILFRAECLHPIRSIRWLFDLIIIIHLFIVCLFVSIDWVKHSLSEAFSTIITQQSLQIILIKLLLSSIMPTTLTLILIDIELGQVHISQKACGFTDRRSANFLCT